MAIFGHLVAPKSPSAQDLGQPLAGPSRATGSEPTPSAANPLARNHGARTALIGPVMIAAGSVIFGNLLGLIRGLPRAGSSTRHHALGRLHVVAASPAGDHRGRRSAERRVLVGGRAAAAVIDSFDARITRAATLEQVQRPYVEAARTLGLSDWRVMFVHVWPNVSTITIPNAFLDFAGRWSRSPPFPSSAWVHRRDTRLGPDGRRGTATAVHKSGRCAGSLRDDPCLPRCR